MNFRAWARHALRQQRKRAAKVGRAAVVSQIQQEAKDAGATLANGGKGGLDPGLALEVFRRDKWQCQNEDCPTPAENLDLDHISGHAKEIAEDPKARKNPDLKKGVEAGHVNETDALHVICKPCHDRAHQREEAIEDGEKPRPMRGDRR